MITIIRKRGRIYLLTAVFSSCSYFFFAVVNSNFACHYHLLLFHTAARSMPMTNNKNLTTIRTLLMPVHPFLSFLVSFRIICSSNWFHSRFSWIYARLPTCSTHQTWLPKIRINFSTFFIHYNYIFFSMKTIIYTSHVSRIAVVIQLLKCLTKCFADDSLDKRPSPSPKQVVSAPSP